MTVLPPHQCLIQILSIALSLLIYPKPLNPKYGMGMARAPALELRPSCFFLCAGSCSAAGVSVLWVRVHCQGLKSAHLRSPCRADCNDRQPDR